MLKCDRKGAVPIINKGSGVFIATIAVGQARGLSGFLCVAFGPRSQLGFGPTGGVHPALHEPLGQVFIGFVALERLVGREKAGAHGFVVHVIGGGGEVVATTFIDYRGFVASDEEVAEELMAAVKAAGVGAQKPFYADDQVGQGRLGVEMERIIHAAPSMEFPAGLFAGSTRVLDSGGAEHAMISSQRIPIING